MFVREDVGYAVNVCFKEMDVDVEGFAEKGSGPYNKSLKKTRIFFFE